MSNYFKKYNWKKMLSLNPYSDYDITKYHSILCSEKPDFLNKYLNLKILKRLQGIGLLCGTDWTTLYKNRIYYSRLDHSIGVALIIWNFTHDKAQTIAGILHDVSTPVFSHVSDFRKGDALTQTVTEDANITIIKQDKELLSLLKEDNLTIEQIQDYHNYPIADNEIPQLSADRLEYMFPSGMALDGSWDLASIKKIYDDIIVVKNEDGEDELGFKTLECAEEYCRRFCMIGHILQLNENKLTLQLLGQIMNFAEKENIFSENDFMQLSETEIIHKLNDFSKKDKNTLSKSQIELINLYKTFRNMKKIKHTNRPLKNHFCVNLKVKQRYINPLVLVDDKAVRISNVSKFGKKLINDFLSYSDKKYGCVKIITKD